MYTIQSGGTQCVVTAKGPATHRVHLVGPHPILQHFLDRMNFHRTVNSCLASPGRMTLNHAQTLAIFTQNIILSPAPLYRVAEWARPIDPAALGLSASEKEALNDDRIARSLDALVSPQARTFFFQLALQVIKQFELDTQRIHNDTTTVTFHGKYQGSIREPQIVPGHNKDHRPDLKQLVFGLNVTADGAVPISHDVYSGNRTDDTIHQSNVDRLRQILGRTDFTYVADCKVCTRKNLAHIAQYGGRFVTVIPRTYADDKRFRKKLRDGDPVRWRRLVEIEDPRDPGGPPIVYYTTADGPSTTREGYRIIWIRSSQKKEHDAEAREANLKRTEVALDALDARLNRGKLRSRGPISKKVKEILRAQKVEDFIKVRIASKTHIQLKRLRSGRPRKDAPVKEIRTRVYHLEVERNKQALLAEARTDGVFPLLSNLEPKKASKKEILLIYKYQPYVEKRHALFKSELEVAPVYLKKPRRAAGLVHCVFLAMSLDALIERTLRMNMKREGIEALPILPEGRMSKTPTTARLLEMFSNVSWYEFEQSGETVTFPIVLSTLQQQLLRLLDMDPKEYG